MDVPFVVLCPLAGGDQDGELAQHAPDRGVEPQVVAHRPRVVHQLRAVHHRFERTEHRHLARCLEVLGRLLLLVRVLFRGNRRQPFLGEGGVDERRR